MTWYRVDRHGTGVTYMMVSVTHGQVMMMNENMTRRNQSFQGITQMDRTNPCTVKYVT